jgi:predicted TIM-barrel fold metal-dependent hydrolase
VTTIPLIVSVDDHVIEPPHLWQRWLPAKHRDRGPRVVRAPYELIPMGINDKLPYRRSASGPKADFWEYGNLSVAISMGEAAAGNQGHLEAKPISFNEMRPGCYDLPARLEDMTINHVERSLCFPTFTRFCGQVFLEAVTERQEDPDLALACVQAYNDWMVDEWAGESGGRMIPLCLIPMWEPRLAAAEIRRNAARGVRAVTFSELPQFLGLPSLYDAKRHWDPFLAACDESGTVICMHIGSASRALTSADDAPAATRMAVFGNDSQLCLVDWLISGTLSRFPGLRLAFSESQVGWMPYVLQRLDTVWRQHKDNPVASIPPELTEPPSSYVRGRIYGCIVQDDLGLQARGGPLGIDQITFESDYPHGDSLWPNTLAYAEQALADYDDDEIEKIIRTNAIKLFDLPEQLSPS